jgi:hypothetical protein
MPTRRLNAAGVWLQLLPLARIWYLTPRPSMPPADMFLEYERRGREPSGGQQDFAWVIFERGHQGLPTVGWLPRDESRLKISRQRSSPEQKVTSKKRSSQGSLTSFLNATNVSRPDECPLWKR